jgi:hypothetical protein
MTNTGYNNSNKQHNRKSDYQQMLVQYVPHPLQEKPLGKPIFAEKLFETRLHHALLKKKKGAGFQGRWQSSNAPIGG